MLLQDRKSKERKIIARTENYEWVEDEITLPPTNHAEIIVNTSQTTITRKLFTIVKPISIAPGKGIVFSSRNTGMIIKSDTPFGFHLFKLNPLYTQSLFQGLENDLRNRHLIIDDIDFRIESLQVLIKELQNLPLGQLDLLFEKAINIIKEKKGEVRINNLCEQLDIRKVHLENKFKNYIGLTPKEFSKIEKINHFMDNITKYINTMTLTQLTFKSGYYDQSHLIKDFRFFMDMKPSEYIRQLV